MPVENIPSGAFGGVIKLVSKGDLAREAISDVLRQVAKTGSTVQDAIQQLGLTRMTRSEVLKLVSLVIRGNQKLIDERGEAALKPLMGTIMEKARGRADGKTVHELLEQELRKSKSK